MTLPDPITRLLAARRLEQVPPDAVSARVRLDRAEEKLQAARQIAAIDIDIAYVTAYDAARIAVTAHTLSNGLRARAVARAHEAVGDYAEAMVHISSASEFHRMRRRRNKSEYDDIAIGRADLEVDLQHAEAIVGAVRAVLGP